MNRNEQTGHVGAHDNSRGGFREGFCKEGGGVDDYRRLLLLDELSQGKEHTQRELSKKLGMALGLINSYIKNLASRGFITISMIPRNRYRYYLTPSGFKEKTRLTYEHLRNFTNLYRFARRDFRRLFGELKRSGFKKVAFCGVDEVSEIALLSLNEAGLELAGVLDDDRAGQRFFNTTISPIKEASALGCELIVITAFDSGRELEERLKGFGIKSEKVCNISGEGWLDRISGGTEKQKMKSKLGKEK